MKTCCVWGLSGLLALVLGLSGSFAGQETIKVASWNLDLHKVEGDALIRHQSPDDLAAVIRLLGADILVLQEVDADMDVKASRGQNRVLKQALRQVPGDWEHTLLPADGVSVATRTGIAWNTDRVELINGSGWEVPVRSVLVGNSGRKRTWPRKPAVFHFRVERGLTDFLVIPLHQTADVGSRSYVEARYLEAESLVEQLPRIRQKFRDQDVAIVGRFGQEHDEPGTKLWQQAGLTDINRDDQPSMYLVNRAERRLDLALPMTRAFVSLDQPELDAPGFTVLQPEELSAVNMTDEYFYRRVSDYMPAWFTVAVIADDD